MCEMSESRWRPLVGAPDECFSFPICCCISKPDRINGEWHRKSPSKPSCVFDHHYCAFYAFIPPHQKTITARYALFHNLDTFVITIILVQKKSFYRAANAVFSKIGRVASEEVTLQLIKCKCLSVLWSMPCIQICSHWILTLTCSSRNSSQPKVLKL